MKIFRKGQFGLATGAAGLTLFFAATALLQAQQPDANVRAARLSDVEGDVQLSQGSQVLANPALVNTPLFEGVLITTKDDGRAELQFDDGSVARVSPNSSLKIAVLRQEGSSIHTELDLQSGLAYFELQGDGSGSRTFARFGDSALSATGFSVLRVNLDNPPGEVAVFSGNAHLQRGTSLSIDLLGGQSVSLNAADPSIYNLSETIEPDSWDAWNADRDQDLTSQQAAKTAASSSAANSNNPAWADLDANGSWYNVPDQGYVWSPNEAASGSWEPYGCGNWVWTPQFGYVWVPCEQWGYLPYMSGSWSYYADFGWGWSPGYGYPWWATGGWNCNVHAHPVHYQPPQRPRGGPVKPPNQPIHHAGYYQPNPVISVNRGPSAPTGIPIRVIGKPVTIAGNTVAPLKPLMPRPVYGPPPSSGFNRPNPGYPVNSGYGVNRGYGVTNPGAGNRGTGYIPWANTPGSHGSASSAPTAPSSGYLGPVGRGYSGPVAPPTGHVYSGGSISVPRVSPGGGVSAPHVNSGGGGGGGGHVSGGGGGHVSGGGGGGGGHVGGGGGAAPPAGGNHH